MDRLLHTVSWCSMYKEVLVAIAVAIGFYSYIPYFRDIYQGKTKPHAFSWLIWGTMTAIAFVAQVTGDGGPGALVLGFTVVACAAIFVCALFRGEKRITRIDWLCLLGAAVAIGLWAITNGPLLSVILITIIDALGIVPTFRKSYSRPHEETLITYQLSMLKFTLAVLALTTFSVVTVLYPLSLVITNGAVVTMLLIRRRQLTSELATSQTSAAG